jgi:hypothetical protein
MDRNPNADASGHDSFLPVKLEVGTLAGAHGMVLFYGMTCQYVHSVMAVPMPGFTGTILLLTVVAST